MCRGSGREVEERDGPSCSVHDQEPRKVLGGCQRSVEKYGSAQPDFRSLRGNATLHSSTKWLLLRLTWGLGFGGHLRFPI